MNAIAALLANVLGALALKVLSREVLEPLAAAWVLRLLWILKARSSNGFDDDLYDAVAAAFPNVKRPWEAKP